MFPASYDFERYVNAGSNKNNVSAEDIQITNSLEFFLTLHLEMEKANSMLGSSFVGDMEKEQRALAMIQSASDKGYAGTVIILYPGISSGNPVVQFFNPVFDTTHD